VSRSGIFEFDLARVNPTGFGATVADRGVARLAYDGDAWSIADEFAVIGPIGADGALDPETLPELRRYRALEIDWASHPGGEDVLRWIAAAATAGIPMYSRGAAGAWASPLGDELLKRLDGGVAENLADQLQRELYSVRQRRAALAARTREEQRKLPTVSAMICTCRPEFVGNAVQAVDRQRYPGLEIVLVLHGCDPADDRIRAALRSTELPVRVLEVDEDVVFGEALNAGIAAASGEYVTKMDDDDWYGPNYIGDLINAAWYSGAAIVGSFTELVHLEELQTTIHRPAGGGEKYSTFVAGGTITATRETMRELGGFPPLPRGIDVGLFERAREAEAQLYRNHGLEYLFSRRSQGHTWDVGVGYFLKSAERQWYKKPFAEQVMADGLEHCLTR
jgi:hypothetical protein